MLELNNTSYEYTNYILMADDFSERLIEEYFLHLWQKLYESVDIHFC